MMTAWEQVPLIIAAAAFAVVLVGLLTFGQPNPVRQRLKRLSGTRERTRRRRRISRRGFQILSRAVVDRFNLMRSQQALRITDRMAQAGWRGQSATYTYLFAKLCGPVGFAIVAALLTFGLNAFGLSESGKLMVSAGAAILGAYAPDIYVKNVAMKRQEVLRKGLPDMLDLLVVCAEAGLSMDAAFDRVARELKHSTPELADELSQTVLELRFLPERRRALDNLSRRIDLPAVQALVNTLIQTERYGTPLAQSLRILAGEMRHQRLIKAEEKAARLPAIMTVPLIVFILPTLFVVLLGPAALEIMDNFVNM